MKEWLLILMPLAVAGIGYLGIRQNRENKRLSALNADQAKKLRRALRDCLAFYALEESYCKALAVYENRTALAMKRSYRARLRASGGETPSDQATPEKITSELLQS